MEDDYEKILRDNNNETILQIINIMVIMMMMVAKIETSNKNSINASSNV